MKILFINTLYYPNNIGGAEKSVQILAETLVELGHEIIIISLSTKKNIKRNWAIRHINGVKIYYLKLYNIYNPFNVIKKNELKRMTWHLIDIYNPIMKLKVKEILQNERPDLVHTNNLSGFSVSAWSAIKNEKIPLIHTIRDFYLPCYFSTMFKKGKVCTKQCFFCFIIGYYKKRLSFLPDKVTGVSEFIIKSHKRLGFFLKNRYGSKAIGNSIPFQPKQFNEIRNSDKIKLGFLGRLDKNKGIKFLIEDFVKMDNSKFELHIGGTGDYSLIERHLSNSNIYYYGKVSPDFFFQKIDLLIVPSISGEAFGRVIVEAYQYGIPVLGTIFGGIPEIIDNGTTGYLYDPYKKNDFHLKLDLLTNDKKKFLKIKKKCFDRSVEFQNFAIAKKYLEEYKQIYHEKSIS